LPEDGAVCRADETTGAGCRCAVVEMGVVASTGCASVVGVVGDVTCGIRNATFAAPGAFGVSAGVGCLCEVVERGVVGGTGFAGVVGDVTCCIPGAF